MDYLNELSKLKCMYSNFIGHILEVCKTLNENNVKFIIVGGTATSFHGFHRMTVDFHGLATEKHDFDFWFDPSYENYYNILKAMKSLGKDVKRLEEEIAPNPKKSFLKFNFEDFKIDFLPEIKGLSSFSESYANCVTSNIQNVTFKILSLDDLITTKETESRPKDIADLAELRKLRNLNKG